MKDIAKALVEDFVPVSWEDLRDKPCQVDEKVYDIIMNFLAHLNNTRFSPAHRPVHMKTEPGFWFYNSREDWVWHYTRKRCELLTFKDTVLCISKVKVDRSFKYFVHRHKVGECCFKLARPRD